MANHPIPFAMAPSLPRGGVLPGLVIDALESQGVHVVVHWYPTKRAFTAVKDGACDISPGWCKNSERQQVVVFSGENLGKISYLFAYRKEDRFDWHTIKDIEGKRIGARLGNKGYGEVFLAAESSGKISVERVYKNRQSILMLLAGRVDLIIEPRFILQYLLETELSAADRVRIAIHPRPLNTQQVFAIFHAKVSPGIITALDKGIRQMKESGEFARRVGVFSIKRFEPCKEKCRNRLFFTGPATRFRIQMTAVDFATRLRQLVNFTLPYPLPKKNTGWKTRQAVWPPARKRIERIRLP